jgi:hypothetical protein
MTEAKVEKAAPPEKPEKKDERPARSRWRPTVRSAWRIAKLVLLVAVLAAAPYGVELAIPRIADSVVREQLGLRLAIRRVELDLVHARVVARDLSFFPEDGGPAVGTIERVSVELAPREIMRGIVIERLEVAGTQVHLTRREDGTIDLLQTIARARSRKPKSTSRQPSFVIEAASAMDVHVQLVDAGAPAGSDTRTLNLAIVATGLGTVYGRGGGFGHFTARGGGDLIDSVAVEGEIDLASAKDVDQWIRARIALGGIDAGAIARSLPEARARARRLGLAARVGVRFEGEPEGIVRLTLAAADVEATADGVTAFSLEGGEVVLDLIPQAPPWARDLRIEALSLPCARERDGSFTAVGFSSVPRRDLEPATAEPRGDRTGELIEKIEAALARPAGAPGEPVREVLAEEAAVLAPFIPESAFDHVGIKNCSVRLKDNLVPGAPEVELRDLEVELHAPQWLSGRLLAGRIAATVPGAIGRLEVLLSGADVQGNLGVSVTTKLDGLDARLLDPYLAGAGVALATNGARFQSRIALTLERRSRRDTIARASVRDLVFADDAGERARIPSLDIDCVARQRRHLELDVDGVRGSSWIRVRRGRDRVVSFAGLVPAASDPRRPPALPRPARESSLAVRLREVTLDVAASFDDDAVQASTELSLAIGARGLVVGPEPAIGSFTIKGSAPGVARSIEVDGRALASAVTPAIAARFRVALDESLPAAYLASAGIRPLLEGSTLSFRVSAAADLARPEARATLARVSDLALDGPRGTGASVDRVEARVLRGADPALLELPSVVIVGPRIELEATPEGLLVARSFLKGKAEPPSAPPLVHAETRPQRTLSTVRVSRILIERGDIAYVDSVGPLGLHDLAVHAGPLELGPGATRPFDIEATATAAPIASSIHVEGTLLQPLAIPDATFTIRARSIDLEPLRARAPDLVSEVTVHSGSLRATLGLRGAPLREGGFTGILSIRDVAFTGDGGERLGSLTELRAHVIRFDPSSGDVDVASLEIDRPHLELTRRHDGRVEALGIVTKQRFVELSDETASRPDRGREASESSETAPRREESSSRGRAPRLAIDHLVVAEASGVFVDGGVLDERGNPLAFHLDDLEGTAEGVVLGGAPGPRPPLRFELEARFEDGMRVAGDGVLSFREVGVDGHVEGEVRGLNLRKISRYAQNGGGVAFDGGYLDFAARLELVGGVANGEVEIIGRRIRMRRISNSAILELASRFGTGIVLTLLNDWQGDVDIRVPVTGSKVGVLGIVGDAFRGLLLATIVQPVKLVVRPFETPERNTTSWRRKLFGPELVAPVELDAPFDPGSERPAPGTPEVVEKVRELLHHGGRQIRIRAECGPGDRARALRAASLRPRDARSILARLESERRTEEDGRADLAAAERRALASRDLKGAREARSRLLESEARIATLERSMAAFADRTETDDTPIAVRARAEEALRRLSGERVAAIREELVKHGIDPAIVRVRPERIHHHAAFPGTGAGGGGRVTIEVSP